jgi:hypothetical protein
MLDWKMLYGREERVALSNAVRNTISLLPQHPPYSRRTPQSPWPVFLLLLFVAESKVASFENAYSLIPFLTRV